MNKSIDDLNDFLFRNIFLNAFEEGASQIAFGFDQANNTLVAEIYGNGFQHIDFLQNMVDKGNEWLEENEDHPCAFYVDSIFLGQELVVESGAIRLSINRDNPDVLKVSIYDRPFQSGAKLTLFGTSEETFMPEEYIRFLAAGFPVSVFFNGKKVSRLFALDGGLKFSHTEIGEVHVAKSEGRPIEDLAIVLFLNGLSRRLFAGRTKRQDLPHIVHVDPEHPSLQALDPGELVKVVRGTITKLAQQLSVD